MSEQSHSVISQQDRDLGIGARIADMSAQRLLNRDGSFNTERKGIGLLGSLSLYNTLLTMSWPAFFLLLGAFYLLANALFAAAYLLGGPEALSGPAGLSLLEQFVHNFFFSVQTMSTVGYAATSYRPVVMPMYS